MPDEERPGEALERRLELPMQVRAATTVPSTVDEDKRTVELVWSTGARVRRYSWMRGEAYEEEISLDAAHVDLSRLNGGAPLLDSHRQWNLSGVIGVVERAWIKGGEGRAVVRFDSGEDTAEVWRKVREGILRNVSVGYAVRKFEITREEGKLPVYRAVDWQPMEISIVPIGADAAAGVRAGEAETYPCEIVDNRGTDARNREDLMPNDNQPAGGPPAEEIRTPPPAPPANQPEPVDENAVREAAVREERNRAAEIRLIGRKAKLEDEAVQKMIDEGLTVEAARARAIDLLAERTAGEEIVPYVTVPYGGQEETETRRSLMANAMLHRYNPAAFQLEDGARQYRGLSLLDMARDCLEIAGTRTRGLSRMEMATAALNMQRVGGMHSTSDFPYILANVANKTLRQAYEAAPRTFTAFSRQTTAPDFKTISRTQLGEAPQLKKVNESGEFKRGTIGEGREQYQLLTYGRIVAITRQVLINDDLDAFTRLPMMFGRQAANLESDLVWGVITDNAALADGTALFHADHANLTSSGTAISVASLGVGRAMMRKQTGLDSDGTTYLNIEPRFLLVSPDKETLALQYTSQAYQPGTAGDTNPWASLLRPIAEPRLSGNAWYLAATPDQIDTIEYAYLDGQEGVYLEERMGFDVDGMELKARLDFAAKAIDHRGLYKNNGA